MLRFSCFLLLVAAAPAFAQSAPAGTNQAELSTRDETAEFKTRVNLVTVPVVVRDGTGRAIGNLRKEDFQLSDKGKVQVITRFTVETPGNPVKRAPLVVDDAGAPVSAAPPEAPVIPQRFVAYLFDDIHTTFADLARARDAADRNILATLGTADRAAIYTTSGTGNLDFTDDRAKLQAALLRLRYHPVAQSGANQCPNITYFMADAIVNRNDQQALQAAMLETVGCMNLDPTQPSTTQVARQVSLSTAQQQLTVGEQETHVALTVLRDVIRRMGAAPGQRLMVFTSSGFYITDQERFEESEILERAVQAGIIISSLDARGLYTDEPAGDISQPSYSGDATRIKADYARQSSRADADVMAELADGTGGTFYQNSNDLDAGFRRLASPPEFIYVLGFSPQNLKLDGSFHRLKVQVRTGQPKVAIQARRGYYAPRHTVNPADEAKQEIAEALFSQEELRDLPVDLHTQYFKSSDNDAKLAIMAHLDLKHFQFHKAADGRNNNELTIVAGLFDRNGNYITAIRKLITLRLLDSTLANRLDRGITVKSSFDVKPGSYVVRLVVRDAEAQQMAAESGAVEIP